MQVHIRQVDGEGDQRPPPDERRMSDADEMMEDVFTLFSDTSKFARYTKTANLAPLETSRSHPRRSYPGDGECRHLR